MLSSRNIDESDWFNFSFLADDKSVYNFYKDVLKNKLDKGETNNINKREYVPINYGSSIHDNGSGDTSKLSYSCKEFKDRRVKYAKEVNWNQKFTGTKNSDIIITTFSLPDNNYLHDILDGLFRRGNELTIIANSKFSTNLASLRDEYAKQGNTINCKCYDNLHAKMVLIDDKNNGKKKVWLSSQNFGNSSWFENTILIKNNNAVYNFVKRVLDSFI